VNWKTVPERRSSARAEILAVDLATVTGFARGFSDDLAPSFGTVKFVGSKRNHGHPGDANHTFALALQWMTDMIEQNPPDILMIESMLPPDAMRNQTSRQVRDRLAGLHGIVRACAKRGGVGEISEVSVGDVRAHFIGTRGLQRLDAKRAVIERCKALGWNVANDNEGDACAIWSFAVSLIDPQQALRVSPLFNRNLRIAR